jgi:hypothetical protein
MVRPFGYLLVKTTHAIASILAHFAKPHPGVLDVADCQVDVLMHFLVLAARPLLVVEERVTPHVSHVSFCVLQMRPDLVCHLFDCWFHFDDSFCLFFVLPA